MLQRLINIALVFALLISANGEGICAELCSYRLQKEKPSCCQKDQSKDNKCCSSHLHKASVAEEISVVNVPDFKLTKHWIPVSFSGFERTIKASLSTIHCFDFYEPPSQKKNITILIQVFRI